MVKSGKQTSLSKRQIHSYTSARNEGKPLVQPKYSMKDVPKCSSSPHLEGSVVEYVTDREYFRDALAEMVLLCNEVMRRRVVRGSSSGSNSSEKRTSKPLGLEYMADRIDIDDPLFGFVVRTATTTANASTTNSNSCTAVAANVEPQRGMMQGFITISTFTNWQNSFRFDSIHPNAFAYDDIELSKEMSSHQRKYDIDGSLAALMQNTIHAGNPWDEGIVWPHIAEISLLGALGCGKTLIQLALERLENQVKTGLSNYEFVVLQATKNSIPFYESMGFIRVGAIIEDVNFDKKNKHNSLSDTLDETKPIFTDFASPILLYKTKKNGENLKTIAKSLSVDVLDIIFLNQKYYPTIQPNSSFRKNTSLYYPDLSKLDGVSNASIIDNNTTTSSNAIQWYLALDNETPRDIAKKFNVDIADLLKANKGRVDHLQAQSKLIEGTKIQVSHFDIHFDKHVPYCHWTFPDDVFEKNEPSYMMAKKLDCKKVATYSVEKSLAAPIIPILQYTSSQSQSQSNNIGMNKGANVKVRNQEKILTKTSNNHVSPSSPQLSRFKTSASTLSNHSTPNHTKQSVKIAPPTPPKHPKPAYFFFLHEQKDKILSSTKMSMPEISKLVSVQWRQLSPNRKHKYEQLSDEAKKRYKIAAEKYKKDLKEFQSSHPDYYEQSDLTMHQPSSSCHVKNLFNKVVKLNTEGRSEIGDEYEYYFVLTFLPDLFWCHLAPLRKVGFFGSNKPKAQGRPIWMLVAEEEGKEFDISANACEIVKSVTMKGCANADLEQWDIMDGEDFNSNTHQFDHLNDLEKLHTVAKKGRGRPPKSTEQSIIRKSKKRSASEMGLSSDSCDRSALGNPIKRPRGRPRKPTVNSPNITSPSQNTIVGGERRGRGRPRKTPTPRGRPRKLTVNSPNITSPSQNSSVLGEKRGRGRPRKTPTPTKADTGVSNGHDSIIINSLPTSRDLMTCVQSQNTLNGDKNGVGTSKILNLTQEVKSPVKLDAFAFLMSNAYRNEALSRKSNTSVVSKHVVSSGLKKGLGRPRKLKSIKSRGRPMNRSSSSVKTDKEVSTEPHDVATNTTLENSNQERKKSWTA
jgi:hypothetical protein